MLRRRDVLLPLCSRARLVGGSTLCGRSCLVGRRTALCTRGCLIVRRATLWSRYWLLTGTRRSALGIRNTEAQGNQEISVDGARFRHAFAALKSANRVCAFVPVHTVHTAVIKSRARQRGLNVGKHRIIRLVMMVMPVMMVVRRAMMVVRRAIDVRNRDVYLCVELA